ncbi:MAG: hypothetical protein EXR09_00840 [Acetobacteraceae bacterium]|nr:hypothetical protein [Acetobacteraceae bacterium]
MFDFAYADLDPRFYAVVVHRAALHGVLWDAFAASGARIETGRMITGPDARFRDRLSLQDNTGQSHGVYGLAVDATGAHSPLRNTASRDAALPFAYGAVWADVADFGLAPHTLVQRYVTARQILRYLPIGRTAA